MKILKILLIYLLILISLLGLYLGYKFLTLPDVIGSEPSFYKACDVLIYTSESSGVSQIYTVHLRTGEIKQITDTFSDKHYPVVSPDGNWLVFNEEVFGEWVLSLRPLNKDSSHIQIQLNTFNPMKPSWSHDSKKLVYPAVRGSVRDLYAYTVTENRETPIVQSQSDKSFPILLSETNTIAYVEKVNGNREIMLSDLENGSKQQLTRNSHYDSQLSLSLDRASLIFRTKRDGSDQLMVHELSNGQQKSLKAFKSPIYYPSACGDDTYILAMDDDAGIQVYRWFSKMDSLVSITP